ncbi:SCAN domain-containing protein 3-like [Ranitomeya variabilis]|uniref:SCAN domain-containing protein 3-like n=1 Tax=Ranitomeya variabilis TaxID=490064 RepID=UPI0040564F88
MSKKQTSLKSFFEKEERPNETDEDSMTAKKKKAAFKRKYNESYLNYGKKREHEGQKQLLKATTSTSVSALRASFLVANRIAKAKKPFTIGEELILPAAKDICQELLGEAAVKKVAQVPLSASTVTRRINEIAEDIEVQLLERINASPWYAIQVDESTDVDNKAMMLVYVRYIFQEDVHEDMLCALLLPANTTGAELFKSLDDYISGNLNWSFCVGICTDGAAAMTGRLSGLTTRVKEVASECESTHCVIHREMLASRKMSSELNSVLQDVIKVINHIKAHALNSRLFEQLCEEMDAEHKCLLLHTEVRWLSKGRALARVFELRDPLYRFLLEKELPLAAHFSSKEWVTKLAYLCDIFNFLNELNLSLQGRMTTAFKLADKVAAFKAKLEVWGRRVRTGIFDMFQTLAGILEETEPEPSFSQLVHDHLSQLSEEFECYFPTTKDPRTRKEWIRNPFVNKPGESTLSVLEEDQLLEIANDGSLKSMFETSNLPTFWIKVKAEYPGIATKALKTLLPFPTSYLCETVFSAMTTAKTRLRSRLDIRNTLRVSLSPITPRWDRLVAGKQAHYNPKDMIPDMHFQLSSDFVIRKVFKFAESEKESTRSTLGHATHLPHGEHPTCKG